MVFKLSLRETIFSAVQRSVNERYPKGALLIVKVMHNELYRQYHAIPNLGSFRRRRSFDLGSQGHKRYFESFRHLGYETSLVLKLSILIDSLVCLIVVFSATELWVLLVRLSPLSAV